MLEFKNYTNFYYPTVGVEEDPSTSTSTKLPAPKTPKEQYLAKIAGEDVTIPEPKTRAEYYLNKIAETGVGYTIEKSKNNYIPFTTVTTEEVNENGHVFYKGYITGLFAKPPATLIVSYNADEYEVNRVDLLDGSCYGAQKSEDDGSINFDEFPFMLRTDTADPSYIILFTETVMIAAIKADKVVKTVVPSEDFIAAVKASVGDSSAPAVGDSHS